jgi:hypothetical protein
MIFVFVDETSDNKYKDYFGISVAVINSSHYHPIKKNFHSILNKSTWNSEIEFKGSFLFSSKKGDPNVSIDERIDICSNLLQLNKSKINARMKFYYVVKHGCTDQKADYLKYLPKLLDKALSKAQKGNGKNLISIQCDYRDDIKPEEIRKSVQSCIQEKGYELFEDIVISDSCFHTVGILYADIVGYLFARKDIISNDSDLFSNLTEEEIQTNGKILKLKSSNKLLNLIKEFKAFEVITK